MSSDDADPSAIWGRWWPVTHDHGLIQAELEETAEAWEAAYAAHDIKVRREDLAGSLDDCLHRLEPVSPAPTKELFLATRVGWTVYLSNGLHGSDPFLPMSRLARRLGVTAMRVCISPPQALHPGVIWEVYELASNGGDRLGYRRSIAAAKDGDRWVFEAAGEAYPFEDTQKYKSRLKKDRFTETMLAEYLARFGIPALADDAFNLDGRTRGLLLSRPPHDHLPHYTLDEALAQHGR